MRFIIMSALIVCSSPALALEDPSAATAQPSKEKKICKNQRATGSRIPIRECRTEWEWKFGTIDDERKALMLSKSTGSGGPISGKRP